MAIGIVDLLVFFDCFRNIDFLEQGYYHIRCRIYLEKEKTLAVPDSYYKAAAPIRSVNPKHKRFEPFIFIPNSNTPNVNPTNAPSTINPNHQSLVPSTNNDIISSALHTVPFYSTRTFWVQSQEEIIDLNEIIHFRLYMGNLTVNYPDPLVIMELDLMFNKEEDIQSVNDLKPVANQKYRIRELSRGIHQYHPVTFNEWYYSVIDVSIHSVLTGFTLPELVQTPPSSPPSKLSYAPSFISEYFNPTKFFSQSKPRRNSAFENIFIQSPTLQPRPALTPPPTPRSFKIEIPHLVIKTERNNVNTPKSNNNNNNSSNVNNNNNNNNNVNKHTSTFEEISNNESENTSDEATFGLPCRLLLKRSYKRLSKQYTEISSKLSPSHKVLYGNSLIPPPLRLDPLDINVDSTAQSTSKGHNNHINNNNNYNSFSNNNNNNINSNDEDYDDEDRFSSSDNPTTSPISHSVSLPDIKTADFIPSNHKYKQHSPPIPRSNLANVSTIYTSASLDRIPSLTGKHNTYLI